MSSTTETLAPALEIDARLTEIERGLNLLLNVTPVNAAQRSWAPGTSSQRGRIHGVGHSVVKPLYGAKGRNVFVIEDEEEANLAQITEAVLEDGYALAQQFVDGGEDGDARIFLLDGQILEREGQLAAFRRVPDGNDPRTNISKGGHPVPLEIGEVERGIVEAMGERLVADGMFFVGIDVIGDKVVEINAESPGGMQAVERLYEIDVCPTVIEELERRTGSR